ncbi:hypothetical protein GQ472_01070 [archaeon]|nr:hypothetical protein [archaeon]
MFHVVTDKRDEYIFDNEGRVTAAKMSGGFWGRTYCIKYNEAPVFSETYSEISKMLAASDNVVDFDEFYPPTLKKIDYSAIDIYRGNSDAIESLLQDESLIDVLDNLVPLEIMHLIKSLESDEETKDLVEMANNYIEWLVYGNHLFCSNPEEEIKRLNKLKENISS